MKRLSRLRTYGHAYLTSAHAHLDQLDEAKVHAAQLLEMKPELTIAGYVRSLRYGGSDAQDHLRDGLPKAGLPQQSAPTCDKFE